MAIGDGVSAIAQLAMTFGGFSPTAMDGVEATKEQIERVQLMQAQKKESDRRRREIEQARASAPKSFTDEFGMTWQYVVMDNAFVRIDRCKREIAYVNIPESIEGLPVRMLGSDVFDESDKVVEVVCPDTVEVIRTCAFRMMPNLKRVVFPERVSNYSASWLQHCDSVEEIVLPGMLQEITAPIFDSKSLKRLHIGRATMGVTPGACERTHLEAVSLDAENPFLYSDGNALYSYDKSEMIALVRPVEAYCVLDGCKRIAKKCCMGIGSLGTVHLPDSIQEIGEYAFAHTGLQTVDIPPSVQVLKTRSFFHCSELHDVVLNEGLKEIEDAVFAESGLRSLYVPASIDTIGTSVTANTEVNHSGPEASFVVSEASKTLYFDGEGGLYRREPDGMHFIQLIDNQVASYRVAGGTSCIEGHSFAFHEKIREVILPEGVEQIAESAFRVCRNLRRVTFPESLRIIGKEAFLDTMIESVYLPAGFEELSDDALVTAGAHRLGEPPSLREISVHPDNRRFYVESGLLCRRGASGDRGIVFNDDEHNVVIPESVTTIAPFAFSNARNIHTFTVGPTLETIGTGGLSTWCSIENIHIEVGEPIEGRNVFDVRFPDTPRTPHEISISLGGSSWINVQDIMRHYDNCLANAHDYNMRESDGISAYEQVKLILGRLNDPILLTSVNRSVFERMIREHLGVMCVDIARHDDRVVFDDLFEHGFLNEDNLEYVISEVGRLQDAAMTGYLLEQKRVRYHRNAIDFDL